MPRISSPGSWIRLLLALWVGGTISLPASASEPDAAALAARIDHHLAAAWNKAQVTPAHVISDAGFARRAYLDLVGRIPTAAESRTFIADPSQVKRADLVRKLIASRAHARHFAGFWRRVWVPQSETGEYSRLAEEIESWLGERLRSKAPYNELAAELLTPTEGGAAKNGAWRFFYAAAGDLPENLAANTTRSFLGVNLDCAQCHDHPFAVWSQDQFWQTAAFFAKPLENEKSPRIEATIKEAKLMVEPVFLSSKRPNWPEQASPSAGPQMLAQWITAKENPYFAKNAVNRLWAQFFGAGLIEPLDDLSGQVPASHPELLEELTIAFADSNFNLEYLVTAFALTHAYQLDSTSSTSPGAIDHQLFAEMPVRGLTGEQLHDSLRIAAGYPPEAANLDPNEAARQRRAFAGRFRTERATEAERSVTQSLALINGKLAVDLTTPSRSPMLLAITNAPFLDTKQKIETLFFASLGRPPTSDELAPLLQHVDKPSNSISASQALSDVFWALLNSSEFNTNH